MGSESSKVNWKKAQDLEKWCGLVKSPQAFRVTTGSRLYRCLASWFHRLVLLNLSVLIGCVLTFSTLLAYHRQFSFFNKKLPPAKKTSNPGSDRGRHRVPSEQNRKFNSGFVGIQEELTVMENLNQSCMDV